MPRIAPVSMILGLAVGALFTLAVALVIVANPFDHESLGRARAATSVPIAANGGLVPPQAG